MREIVLQAERLEKMKESMEIMMGKRTGAKGYDTEMSASELFAEATEGFSLEEIGMMAKSILREGL